MPSRGRLPSAGQPAVLLELLEVFGHDQPAGQADDGDRHALALARPVLDADGQPDAVALGQLLAGQAALSRRTGALSALAGVAVRQVQLRVCGKWFFAPVISTRSLFGPAASFFSASGTSSRQRPVDPGGEAQLGDLLVADEQAQLAGLGRPLVGPGVGDQRLEGQDGRLRRAEAALRRRAAGRPSAPPC